MEDGISLRTVMLFVVHISAVNEHKAHNSSSVSSFSVAIMQTLKLFFETYVCTRKN
jgi:hypothetical protein